MRSDPTIRVYLLRRLREIGASIVNADSDTITISVTELSSRGMASSATDLLESQAVREDEPVLVDEAPMALVKRERLINLEDYEHDSLEIRKPVPNTDDAIDAQIQALDLRLDIWEMRAKASCVKRRIEAREQERRAEEEARAADERETVEMRTKVLALVQEHPDWTATQICAELGDKEYRAREVLRRLTYDGELVRDQEKGVWLFPEEEKEEQGEQSDPVVY